MTMGTPFITFIYWHRQFLFNHRKKRINGTGAIKSPQNCRRVCLELVTSDSCLVRRMPA